MSRATRWTRAGGWMGITVLLLAGAGPHDPTAHPAWQPFGEAGATPGVRALAVDGNVVYALCDKGLVRVTGDGAQAIMSAKRVGGAQAVDATPEAFWLGGPDGVQRFDRKTRAVETWKPAAPFQKVSRVLFDGQGGIYLFDVETGAFGAFDTAGNLLWQVREFYAKPRRLIEPLAVVRRGGNFYVADGEWNRIVIFTPDGQFAGQVPYNLCRAHGLALLPEGRMAVLCDYTVRIDTPLVTILDSADVAEADWVSDRLMVDLKKPNFVSYCVSYYQKVGERAKRPKEGYSPLVACVAVGEDLVVAQKATGSLRRIRLDAFASNAKYPARRRHSLTRKITSAKAAYTIRNAGTLDWRNTTRWPTHSGYTKTPVFMADDSYTMANTGKVPVVNPHFSVNGKGDYFSAEHIRNAILGGRTNLTELEKAFAVYNFISTNINGTNWRASGTGMQSLYYPFKWWGYDEQQIHLTSKWNNFGAPGACGCYSAFLAKMSHDIGIPGRAGGVVGHCPSFVMVDGKEVYLDSILSSSRVAPVSGFFTPRIDDAGYADYADIIRDQYLVMRVVDPPGDKQWAGCYGETKRHKMNTYEDPPVYVRHKDTSKMALTLRPGESITRRTAYFGRSMIEPEMQTDATVNGDITYTPNFADGTYKYGVTEQKGVQVADGKVRLTSAQGAIAFSMACPHPILTGKLDVQYERDTTDEGLEMDVNIAGRGWERIWRASKVGRATEMVCLHLLDRMRDNVAQEYQVPPFDYQVRFRMTSSRAKPSVAIRGLTISSMFQTFYQCLPRLEVGNNVVAYESETKGPHELTLTHRWKESTFATEPPPPAEPVFPKDGATVTGYEFTFEWKPPTPADGSKVVDYEWVVSKRPDFMWPVLSRFRRYTNGSVKQPVPEYSVLTHGVTYYWRVRSQSDRRVWGPWSRTWTFRCEGPRVPTDVKVRRRGRTWVLSWKPNPKGARPVKYQVFAAHAPGFFPIVTTHKMVEDDHRYPVDKPSNIILTTDRTEAVVVADGRENLDRTFFRVAAIDAAGSRSGPSEFVAAKHPFLFTTPVAKAKVGQAYRYQARSLWSKGHFVGGSRQVTKPRPRSVHCILYPDADKLRFALKRAPKWLTVDATTGLVTGTPAAAGRHTVELEVTDGRDGSDIQAFEIKVTR